MQRFSISYRERHNDTQWLSAFIHARDADEAKRLFIDRFNPAQLMVVESKEIIGYSIAVGSLIGGHSFFGFFLDEEAAMKYAEHNDRIHRNRWHLIPIFHEQA